MVRSLSNILTAPGLDLAVYIIYAIGIVLNRKIEMFESVSLNFIDFRVENPVLKKVFHTDFVRGVEYEGRKSSGNQRLFRQRKGGKSLLVNAL